ncbi:MAG: hypothetical protein JSV50_09735 [Desulfobacteraceae bacterium]|nr:MAG: hypothetical protein JSV50_09735 [Desulfobacteraceae bacterium]
MKRNKRNLFPGLSAMLIIALLCGIAISAENMTMVGTVNDNYQIVTDDEQVYDIADTEKGDELVRLIDRRVRVTGTVEESEGMKLITVTSYEVLEE